MMLDDDDDDDLWRAMNVTSFSVGDIDVVFFSTTNEKNYPSFSFVFRVAPYTSDDTHVCACETIEAKEQARELINLHEKPVRDGCFNFHPRGLHVRHV